MIACHQPEHPHGRHLGRDGIADDAPVPTGTHVAYMECKAFIVLKARNGPW